MIDDILPITIIRVKNKLSKNHKLFIKNKTKVDKKNKHYLINNDFNLYIKPKYNLNITYIEKEIKYNDIFFNYAIKIMNTYMNIDFENVSIFLKFLYNEFFFNDLEICMFIKYIFIFSKNDILMDHKFKSCLLKNIIDKNDTDNKDIHNNLLLILMLSLCSKLYLNLKNIYDYNFNNIVIDQLIFKNELFNFYNIINLEIKTWIYPKLNSIYNYILNNKNLDLEEVLRIF